MQKTELRIHIYGEKPLRKRSSLVTKIDDKILDLRNTMAELMYSRQGIGLAAPQVGVNKQLIIIDIGEGLVTLANPKISKKQGQSVMEEGCLSLPGVAVKVKRPNRVFVQAMNEFGKEVEFWAENLFARVIQHEADHLKGKLIIDYASLLKRLKTRAKFRNLLKQRGQGDVKLF